MNVSALRSALRSAGYHARRPELLALVAALAAPQAGAILLSGPPGTGKTALGEAVARVLGAPCVFHQLHSWSGADDLFYGVDVAAAVAGAPDHVVEPGVLQQAARLSHQHPRVVLVLDEVDKAPDRVEGLLLDFLQTGRCPVGPGRHIQARLESLVTFLTSNDSRPLGEALLRRCRRVQMSPLPPRVERDIVSQRAGVPAGAAAIIVRMAAAIREMGISCPSLQEMVRLAQDLRVCGNAEDVRILAVSSLCKSDEETQAIERLAPALWAEFRRGC